MATAPSSPANESSFERVGAARDTLGDLIARISELTGAELETAEGRGVAGLARVAS
jgi:hypothetical protein